MQEYSPTLKGEETPKLHKTRDVPAGVLSILIPNGVQTPHDCKLLFPPPRIINQFKKSRSQDTCEFLFEDIQPSLNIFEVFPSGENNLS